MVNGKLRDFQRGPSKLRSVIVVVALLSTGTFFQSLPPDNLLEQACSMGEEANPPRQQNQIPGGGSR